MGMMTQQNTHERLARVTNPTDRSRPFAYRFVVGVLRPPLMLFTKRRWSGIENLPSGGGYVASTNHYSYIDPLIFGHFLVDNGQVPHYLGKIEVFKVPVVGHILRAAQQIPVLRESGKASGAYQAAVEAVRKGQCVVIYPEGTLTRDPGLWPMKGKTGAARVALETRCPLIPIANWGGQEIMGVYAKWPRLLPRKTVWVRAGAPVDLSDLYDVPLTRAVLREATDRVMAAITRELEVLRGEAAPAERWDPKAHGQPQIGKPSKEAS